MKIPVCEKSYDYVNAVKKPKHKNPRKPLLIFRWLLQALSAPDMISRNVKFNKYGMEKLGKKEPCLILMNHSCFLDLKIASTLFKNRRFNIVCTSDGFVGKELLMRLLGCIPTQKFVSDLNLVRDIKYAITKNNCSVLMYPEASYTFDGTATPLPESVGKLIKILNVPVVTVITHGAFAHDPLYNGLQPRKVDVSADVTYFLSPDDIKSQSAEEINAKLAEVFSFDNFKWQYENNVKVDESFRADGLNRVLYKCPHCLKEGFMEGKGTKIKCSACGAKYELTEYGKLHSESPIFTHIPDWYSWERECVRKELLDGSYKMEADVDIAMIVDYKSVYKVGSGRLIHNCDGFRLMGCEGKLDYTQPPMASYGLYADYYWYEIGDMICIGNKECLYYCFPKGSGDIVAKTRLAAEELYKIKKK